MNANKREATWRFQGVVRVCRFFVVGFVMVFLLSLTTVAVAQTSQPALVPALDTTGVGAETPTPDVSKKPAGKQVGFITGDNVYVRSGFSTGYYPVMKLGRGAEVTVVDKEFGWLKILPPAGTYSLVDKTYVDLLDKGTGAANDRVWVYAGSDIDKRRYAKQVKLNKGDRVQIIGPTEDGDFYKIVPPAGAHVWISADFVDLTGKTGRAGGAGGAGSAKIESVKPGELRLAQGKPSKGGTLATRPAGAGRDTRAGRLPRATADAAKHGSLGIDLTFSNKYQVTIDAIQAEIAAENSRPVSDRNLAPIIAKLQPIANQNEDEVAQLYAKSRTKQLQECMEVVAAVREIRKLRENAMSQADEASRKRELIRARAVPPMDTIAVRGEIRVSGIYDGSAARPRRWRIVEPKSERTLGYIEVPKGSPIDPVQYYGKYVGIRAGDIRLLRGTVPPAPIYTVEEIEVLDPAARLKTPGSGTLEGRVRGEGAILNTSPSPVTQPEALATETPTATAPATETASPTEQ